MSEKNDWFFNETFKERVERLESEDDFGSIWAVARWVILFALLALGIALVIGMIAVVV